MAALKGTVKWFDIKKGFGFITDENGEDHFIHHTGIEKGRHYTGLEAGDQVEFDLEDTDKKPKAVHLTMIAAVPVGKNAKSNSEEPAEASEPAE